MYKKTVGVIVLSFALLACTKEMADRFTGFRKPDHFPEPVYNVPGNPVTKEGFELGRKLFYEPRLSRNNTISCGSCHIQSAAFTQHGHDVSHGIDDRLGRRNSPAIMNLAWMPTFMWDGGVFDLDLQPIVPITAHEEMDETIPNILEKLRAHPDYPGLYQKAFGTREINTATTMKALAQFMILCISSESKYDSVMRGQSVFTNEETQGYVLFKQHCNSCHTEPLFTDHSFRNNGIAIGSNDDAGRAEVTLNPLDRYRFKVPSLRNLQFTAPYMHDGRFYTLPAVLDHYSSQVQNTPNLDPLLHQSGRLGIALTGEDKTKLLSFLKTLTDRKFIANQLLAE
jgi:cytochrome c peroxidase